jgi:hypothetical protein
MLYEKFIPILCCLGLHMKFILVVGIMFISHHKVGNVGKCMVCLTIQHGVQLLDSSFVMLVHTIM